MFGRRSKGSRRFPGREGGARKRKHPQWRKQAMHAVDESDLGEPLVFLMYAGEWGEPPSVKIYKFDQEIAKTGIRYHAEYLGRWRGGFAIRVLDEHAAEVRNIIDDMRHHCFQTTHCNAGYIVRVAIN